MPTILFESSDTPLETSELAEFLLLFRAAYTHALDVTPDDESEVLQSSARFAIIFEAKLPAEITPDIAGVIFGENRGAHELRISRISKTSPLEISFICALPALVLAVVVSGGQVAISSGKIKGKLPPLRDVIERLRKAFTKQRSTSGAA